MQYQHEMLRGDTSLLTHNGIFFSLLFLIFLPFSSPRVLFPFAALLLPHVK